MLGNAVIQHVLQETALTFPSDGPWKLDAARNVFTVTGRWDNGVTSAAHGVGVEVTGCEG